MNPLAEALRSALLHFLWQGLAVSSLLWIALGLMRRCSANARYVASCIALAVQAALPAWTTVLLYSRPLANFQAPTLPLQIGLLRPGTPSGWQSWALPLWLAGVLIFSIRLGWGYRQVAALRKRGVAADAALRATVSRLSERMGLSRCVRVLTAPLPDGPSVIGWIKPVILIPAATIAGLTPEQLEMVLAHELAHIRRFDYLVNLGQMLIETLLFYHPAVWWVSARIRQERELCCDDIAVRVCGNPISYARALTALEKLRADATLVAMGAASRPLLYRIQRLTGARTRYDSSRWPGFLGISVAMMCMGLCVNWAHGQAPVPQPQLPVAKPAAAKKAPRKTKKKLVRVENPWIAQVIVTPPESPKADPLPADLRHALKLAEYAFGWELGYLTFGKQNQSSEGGPETEKLNPPGADINQDIMRLENEAANASSEDARYRILAQLRMYIDELNQINERLREARHQDGELRDPPPYKG